MVSTKVTVEVTEQVRASELLPTVKKGPFEGRSIEVSRLFELEGPGESHS